MRYQPNILNPCFCRKVIKVLIAIIATMNATMLPISKVIKLSDNIETPAGSETNLSNLYPEAAAIVGTARKKENSAALVLLSFCCIPPMIVAAERETPGIMAIHCHKPIFNAVG